jgi:hypothetical protein
VSNEPDSQDENNNRNQTELNFKNNKSISMNFIDTISLYFIDETEEKNPVSFFEKRADYSLYVFSKENFLRKFCSYLTVQKWFETIISLFIALNCITLAIERPSILDTSIV